MTREPRLVIPGRIHHITDRGNHREPVFASELDRKTYERLVAESFALHSVDLVGYCWMPNHIHQAAIPRFPNSLAKGVGRAQEEYSRWFQTQQCTRGHLWGDRFYSAPVEEVRDLETLLYVELNPVRAGLVQHAWEWPWSSARAHVSGVDSSGLLYMDPWHKLVQPDVWRDMLEKTSRYELFYAEIRAATRSGRPLGSEAFVTALEQQLGRVLRPKPRGRPRKPG